MKALRVGIGVTLALVGGLGLAACAKKAPATASPAASDVAGGAAGAEASPSLEADAAEPTEDLDDLQLRLDKLEDDLLKVGVPLRDREAEAVPLAADDRDGCERRCQLAEAICELEGSICDLADRHTGEDRYADACARAGDDCTRAEEACVACSEG